MNYRVLIFLLLAFNALSGQVSYISTDSLQTEGINPSSPNININNDPVGFRLVFWVHGIAGNAQSWGRVAEVTKVQLGNPIPGYPVRNMDGIALTYQGHEHLRIFGLADYVNNSIMTPWRTSTPLFDAVPVSENFAIGHSQGGIVSRAIRFRNLTNLQPSGESGTPTNFTSLATFGTPHAGAYIINTTGTGGPVQAWIDEGCRAMSDPLILDFVSSKWWLGAIITPSMISGFTGQFCDGLEGLVLPMLVSSIRKDVGMDYADGAPNLDTLQTFASQDTMKVVNFFGIEEDPVFWRVIHIMTNTPDTDPSNLSGSVLAVDPFGLVADQELPDTVNAMYHDYVSKWNAYSTIARNFRYSAIVNFWNPNASYPSLFMAYRAQQNADIYIKGANWLGHSNQNWKRFIGARRDLMVPDGYYCECLVDLGGTNGYTITQTVVQNPSDCNASTAGAINCIVRPKFRHEIIDEESDGVVPVSSQTGYPGALIGTEMLDCNHMQERNHAETRKRLNELFNGAYGDEFKLDEI